MFHLIDGSNGYPKVQYYNISLEEDGEDINPSKEYIIISLSFL